jgi:ketosteroid isomerase-like protein
VSRQEELLRLIEAHSAAESEQDVERTLNTCTDDIVYEHPLYDEDHPDREIHGREAMREYYQRSWSKQPYYDVQITRSWSCGDDTVIAEVQAKLGRPGAPTKTVRGLSVGIFRDGLLAREISYVPQPSEKN